jgi:integrase
MPLTDIKCKSFTPREKSYKITDEKNLYLEIMPSGSKYWRFKFKFAGKENRLAFGVYPEVSLKEAREKRDIARKQLENGINPSEAKKKAKLQQLINLDNSFESIARDWHQKQKDNWTDRHFHYVLRRLEADIFPFLGKRPINEIEPPELLAVLKKIENRGAIDIAKRAKQTTGQIFRYAIANGIANRDITSDLKDALQTRKKKHFNRLEEKELPEFLQKLENYHGEQSTKLALKLLIHTMLRTGEIIGAKWEEIDFDKKEWHIPKERMKARRKHIVPLTKQSIAIIKQIRELHNNEIYLFPNANNSNKTISNNTLLYALYRMGYHSRTTTHGFRGLTSTILNENEFNSDHIELQLAHSEDDKVRASYNHAKYLEQRHKMMKWWSDYLENKGMKI